MFVWSQSRLEPSVLAWSRCQPNFVGAGVGSGTSDFRSRQKKWRLRNTALNNFNCEENLKPNIFFPALLFFFLHNSLMTIFYTGT